MLLALLLAIAVQGPLTPPALKSSRPSSERVEAARQRIVAGDARGAITDLKDVLSTEQRSVDALYWLGIAYLDTGQIDEARDALTGAVDASAGSHADALYHLGLIALQTNDPMQACVLLERAIAKSDSGFPAAEGALAAAYVSAGDFDRAVTLLDKIVAVRPQEPTSQHLLGVALEQRFIKSGSVPDIDRALKAHKVAIDLRPDYGIAHRDYGLALLWQGRAAEAASHLEKFVLFQPAHPSAKSFTQLVERLRSGLSQNPGGSTATMAPAVASGPASGVQLYNPAAPGSRRAAWIGVDGIVLADGSFYSLGAVGSDPRSAQLEQELEKSRLSPGLRAGRPSSLRVLAGR